MKEENGRQKGGRKRGEREKDSVKREKRGLLVRGSARYVIFVNE